ncbi:MAG: phosphoribosylaminoimidazolesuccinocarboxamide synthase [Acidimicrobiaceae bacterium]|nr:phosphoribosylaminoimidazolesuccinocarboxamide synthase [Acidimicrobiaceae bacterium]
MTPFYTGKVRDLYRVDAEHVVMVASDRLSAFDVVMKEPVPDKGRVLTGITHYWVREVASRVGSALVSCDPDLIAERVGEFPPEWAGRAMLVREARMLPLECIVRGRLAGQAYEEYAARGTVHGEPVRKGFQLTDPFDEPRFTPSTKADSGHDVNISLAEASTLVGPETLERAREICLTLFNHAASRLSERGVILADTKFELGWVDDDLVVCDEVVTPDSSRLWPANEVRSGQVPPSFDKQPFRDWLDGAGWNRTPPPPPVPAAVIDETARRYREAYAVVTGGSLTDWYGGVE